jgi:hypothetical protein
MFSLLFLILLIVKTCYWFLTWSPCSLNQSGKKSFGPQNQCIQLYLPQTRVRITCVPLRHLIQSTCTLGSKTILLHWMQSIGSKTEGPIINDKYLNYLISEEKIWMYCTKQNNFFHHIFLHAPVYLQHRSGQHNFALRELSLTIWFWTNVNIF